MSSIYLIGSLRNERIPEIGNRLRHHGHDVFDDWFSAGPEADDYWQRYEKGRGHTFKQGLSARPAINTFRLDHDNLIRCDCAVLVLPAGKSGHLELGFATGRGKRTYILLDPGTKLLDGWEWVTGIFEGEGSLTRNGRREGHGMQLTVTMRDKDIIGRLLTTTKQGSVVGPYVRDNPKWSAMYRWAVNRREEVLYTVKGMWSMLGDRRKQQITTVFDNARVTQDEFNEVEGPFQLRWDIMYKFATDVFETEEDLINGIG